MLCLSCLCSCQLIRSPRYFYVKTIIQLELIFFVFQFPFYLACVHTLTRSFGLFIVKTIFHRRKFFIFYLFKYLPFVTPMTWCFRCFYLKTIFHEKHLFFSNSSFSIYIFPLYPHWYDLQDKYMWKRSFIDLFCHFHVFSSIIFCVPHWYDL